jgi:hypothetical protein
MVQQGITRRTGKNKEEEGKKDTALRTEGDMEKQERNRGRDGGKRGKDGVGKVVWSNK